MAVVINEFEVVPEPQRTQAERASPTRSEQKDGAAEQLPTDHEVKKMIERRLERMERVSTH